MEKAPAQSFCQVLKRITDYVKRLEEAIHLIRSEEDYFAPDESRDVEIEDRLEPIKAISFVMEALARTPNAYLTAEALYCLQNYVDEAGDMLERHWVKELFQKPEEDGLPF